MSPMTKCDEGHFYDKSQNHDCPFCGAGPVDLTRRYPDGGETRTFREKPNVDDEKTRMYPTETATPKAAAKPRDDANGDSERTIGKWSGKSGIDPVVGWLVCYEGANKGRDYRIRSGFNSIGRDTSNQICIAGDETISRIDHAKIFYDFKRGNFHIVQGDGRSGAYVNEQVVLQSTLLKAYDKLEVGSTKLMFVPFCGEHFLWDMSAAHVPPEPQSKPGRDPEQSTGEWSVS